MTPTLEQLMVLAENCDAVPTDYIALESTLRTLLARLVEAEWDARRYRWLRSHQRSAVIRWKAPDTFGGDSEGSDHEHEFPISQLSAFNDKSFDAAVDAAMTDPLED